MIGKIISYKDRGFGFIAGEDNHNYFFHISTVLNAIELEVGCFVEFKAGKNKKGLVATNITIIKNHNQKKNKNYKNNFQQKNNRMLNINGTRIKASDIRSFYPEYEEEYNEYDEEWEDVYKYTLKRQFIKIETHRGKPIYILIGSNYDEWSVWDDFKPEVVDELDKWMRYIDKELQK